MDPKERRRPEQVSGPQDAFEMTPRIDSARLAGSLSRRRNHIPVYQIGCIARIVISRVWPGDQTRPGLRVAMDGRDDPHEICRQAIMCR